MPDLSLPYPVDDSPREPGREYHVDTPDGSVRVHFEKHTAFVRLRNGDFLEALAYSKAYLPATAKEPFLKTIYRLKREWDIG